MDTFVVYDARRERAFVRFANDGVPPVESGYLDPGLWAEFGPGDRARVLLVVIEHPFFGRPAGFVDRVAGLIGWTVLSRLRDACLRDETTVDEIAVDEIEIDGLLAAWDGARRELQAQAGVTLGDANRPANAERHWLVPVRLEPVIARSTRRVTMVSGGFDARVGLPPDLADALRVEPTMRVSVAGQVLRLRGRVRNGEEPPAGITLGVAGVDDEVPLSYDARLGELGAEMELSTPLWSLPDGEALSLLRLRVAPERTGNG